MKGKGKILKKKNEEFEVKRVEIDGGKSGE